MNTYVDHVFIYAWDVSWVEVFRVLSILCYSYIISGAGDIDAMEVEDWGDENILSVPRAPAGVQNVQALAKRARHVDPAPEPATFRQPAASSGGGKPSKNQAAAAPKQAPSSGGQSGNPPKKGNKPGKIDKLLNDIKDDYALALKEFEDLDLKDDAKVTDLVSSIQKRTSTYGNNCKRQSLE